MMATLAVLYLAGAIVMAGFLIRQVVTDWADRPIVDQAGFVALWAVFWPLVGLAWLLLWVDEGSHLPEGDSNEQ